jgi:hypothetical protein
MREHLNSKKSIIRGRSVGASHAPTVCKAVAVEREQLALAPAEVLVRVQAEAMAVANALAQEAGQVLVETPSLLRAPQEALWQASEEALLHALMLKAQERAQARAQALVLTEVHKAMRAWMQELGQAQAQAWLRMSAPEVSIVEEYWWLIQIITPITRLPPELLQQILLIVIDNANESPLVLMRVCKYWYKIVAGIWASLKLGTRTPKDVVTRKLERNQWLLDVVVDTEIDRGHTPSWYTGRWLFDQSGRQVGRVHYTPSGDDYQAIFAAMQATSRWRTLVVETFPALTDFPEDLVNRSLQQFSDPVMSRLRTFKFMCPCEMSPLLDRLLCILGNTATGELTTVTINSPIVISYLVPTYSSIFRSVTVLSLEVPGLHNPVDLLPYLHQLKTLTASHLPLPVYHDGDELPFVHTLRHITLRAVSIQWMSGRTFHILESCTILFPLHRLVLHTFRTTLPNCRHLSFEGYPLNILSGISIPKLTHLSVKCASSYKPRGKRQLALFSSQALQEGRLTPQILHIGIEATSEAWSKALASMSNLEELVIHNAQPSSLGVKALRLLVVLPGTTGTPGEWKTPVCPSLKRFGLRYRRWLRPSEHFDLIPVFISIIRSRQQPKCSLQSFRIWGSSYQKDPLELIDGSQTEFTIELTMYRNRPVVPTKISGFSVVHQRRDVSAWLTLDISSIPTHDAKPWSAIRISRTPSVNTQRGDPEGANILSIDVVVLGATKHKEYTEACRNCKGRRGAGPMIDFRGKTDIIKVTNGIARVHFVFCCYPAHRDEEKYYRYVRSFVLVPIQILTSLKQCRSRLIRMAR